MSDRANSLRHVVAIEEQAFHNTGWTDIHRKGTITQY